MSLHSKISEALHKVAHERSGSDVKKNEKKEPKEIQRGRSVEHSKKHPGFKAVQGKIEKEGYSSKIAGAILASRTRHASAHAQHENLRLKRVKG